MKIKGGSISRWEQPVRNDVVQKEGTWEWKAPFFWDMTLHHWVIGSQHFMGTTRILDHTTMKASKLTRQGIIIMSLGKQRHIARPGCKMTHVTEEMLEAPDV
jgi:hypothetical protein